MNIQDAKAQAALLDMSEADAEALEAKAAEICARLDAERAEAKSAPASITPRRSNAFESIDASETFEDVYRANIRCCTPARKEGPAPACGTKIYREGWWFNDSHEKFAF